MQQQHLPEQQQLLQQQQLEKQQLKQQQQQQQQLLEQQQQQQLLEQQQQQLLEQQQLKQQQQQQQQLLEQQHQQQLLEQQQQLLLEQQQQQLLEQQQQQLNQQQLVEQQLQQLVAENQQQLQLGQQFGYPQHVIQQQMAPATSDGPSIRNQLNSDEVTVSESAGVTSTTETSPEETVSSDDEESHIATASGASVPTAVVHPLTRSVAVALTSDVTSQAESPLVPTAATLTTMSQLYVSRRQSMEDEHGNIVRPPVTETPSENVPPVTVVPTTSHVTLMSRCIRIGSLRRTAQEPVTITSLGIQLCIQCHNERLELRIDATDLVKIIAHFGPQMPLLFIYVSPEGALKIRMACRMDSPDGPMFDPTSTDEKQKRITVILDSLSYEQRDGLRTICHAIQLNHPTLSQGVLLNEISHEHANKILVCSTIDLAQLQVAPPQTQTELVLSNGQLILQHTALPLGRLSATQQPF